MLNRLEGALTPGTRHLINTQSLAWLKPGCRLDDAAADVIAEAVTDAILDGFLPRGKEGDRIINLPSGETFIVPYEGEFEAVPSWTAGTIPVMEDDELVLFHVVANTVVIVEGEGPVAERYAAFFDADPARANIAEVAFGVNDKAEVTGKVLEDEKAGFHWAFGRSDHLGGVVGVDYFESPENVVHQDIVYAEGNPVQVERAVIVHPDGRRCVR